jgi:hypothetical protein
VFSFHFGRTAALLRENGHLQNHTCHPEKEKDYFLYLGIHFFELAMKQYSKKKKKNHEVLHSSKSDTPSFQYIEKREGAFGLILLVIAIDRFELFDWIQCRSFFQMMCFVMLHQDISNLLQIRAAITVLVCVGIGRVFHYLFSELGQGDHQVLFHLDWDLLV